MLRSLARTNVLHSKVPAFHLTKGGSATRMAKCMATVSQQPAAQDGGTQDPFAYCRNFVRTRDYEAFLTSQFYPKHLQDAFFAVRAFYVSAE
jgi:NADH dehydrogenase [ubiquinone] 1 alpha subcomplex assembly factor 6